VVPATKAADPKISPGVCFSPPSRVENILPAAGEPDSPTYRAVLVNLWLRIFGLSGLCNRGRVRKHEFLTFSAFTRAKARRSHRCLLGLDTTLEMHLLSRDPNDPDVEYFPPCSVCMPQ
jgi:hypothetical protein